MTRAIPQTIQVALDFTESTAALTVFVSFLMSQKADDKERIIYPKSNISLPLIKRNMK